MCAGGVCGGPEIAWVWSLLLLSLALGKSLPLPGLRFLLCKLMRAVSVLAGLVWAIGVTTVRWPTRCLMQ